MQLNEANHETRLEEVFEETSVLAPPVILPSLSSVSRRNFLVFWLLNTADALLCPLSLPILPSRFLTDHVGPIGAFFSRGKTSENFVVCALYSDSSGKYLVLITFHN